MIYEVTLTPYFSGVSLSIKTGHAYDWEDGTIMLLTSVDRIILPPGWAKAPAIAYQSLVRRRQFKADLPARR
jgi:hypothetical protein